MRCIAQIAAAALLAACSGTVSPAPSLDLQDLPATVTLRVGESRRIGSAVARFVEVKGDSRCPVDVVCVWAGNAEVALVVGPAAGDGPAHQLLLNTFLEPHEGSALGLRFTLTDLQPSPRSSDKRREYRATIRIERGL